jgi:plastocyanin
LGRFLLVVLFAMSATATLVLTQPHSVSANTNTVVIDGAPNCGHSKFCYNPSSLTVTVGDTVTWVNNTASPHNVTRCDRSACSGDGPGSGGLNGPSSPMINETGGTFAFTFTRSGTYNYYSSIHGRAMTNGRVIVVPATTTPSTTSTTVPSTPTTITRARGATSTQSSGASHTVTIDGSPNCGASDFCYNPPSLTVTAGDAVTWINNSDAPHTVTRCDTSACSGNGPGSGGQSGPSSSTINANGGTYTFTFTSPGTYLYYCAIHGYAMMHGTITVDAATTTTTTTTTAGTTPTTAGSSPTPGSTVGVSSTTPGSSASSPGTAPAATSQLAGTGVFASRGVAVGLGLFLLGLSLMAAASTRRRHVPERTRVATPEPDFWRSPENFGAE